MSEKQKDLVLSKVRELWLKNCEVCGTNNWSLLSRVLELREYFEGNLIIGGGITVPLVMISCDKCGYVRFASAIKLGLIDRETGKVVDG